MKYLFFTILSVLVLTSCDNSEKEKQEQIVNFETKLQEINKTSPYHLYEFSLKTLSEEKSDPNSPFSKWTPEMIQDQSAFTFHAKSEELINLVVEMLVYKGIVTSGGVSINELQSFVSRVRGNESDKIDTMIIESFDLAIQYEETYLGLKSTKYNY